MFKSNKMFRSAAAAALVVAVSTPALATSSTGNQNISWFQYSDDANVPQLQVHLSTGSDFFANTGSTCGSPPLPTPNVETVKIWVSLLQASLLSGKKTNIYYQDCNGYHFIVTVALVA